MVKQIITLSAVAALATTSFASTDLETKVLELEKKMNTLEKKHKKLKKKFNKVKKHTAGDNLKFNVDFELKEKSGV
jgi:predicted  nucleic acid-binding Zn-ribbon protein